MKLLKVLAVSKSTVCVWCIDSDLWDCCSASQGDFVSALLAGLQVWMTISRLQFVYFFIQRQGRSILIYRETESQMPWCQRLDPQKCWALGARGLSCGTSGVTPAPATLCCALGTELVSHFAFRAEHFFQQTQLNPVFPSKMQSGIHEFLFILKGNVWGLLAVFLLFLDCFPLVCSALACCDPLFSMLALKYKKTRLLVQAAAPFFRN